MQYQLITLELAKTSLQQLILAVLALVPLNLFACGPSYEEAPPTLEYYLQRLPAKSLGLIYAEHPELYVENVPEPKITISDLIQKYSTDDPKSLLPVIDEWLLYKRQHYTNPGDLNFLHDMKDLAQAADKPDPAFTEYLNWRKNNAALFQKGSNNYWDKPKIAADILAEIDRNFASAPAILKPHWLYLKGALYFKSIDDVNSEVAFDKILKDFPSSPRAESALFMKARCKFSQSAIWNYQTSNREGLELKNQLEARDLFGTYLQKYPEGRFVGDAWGWIGGLDYKEQKYSHALICFIRQIRDINHPELFTPATVMCEKILYEMSYGIGTEDLETIAKEPRLAMALTYLILNTDYREGEYTTDETVKRKEWRKKILPLIAEAVAKEQKRYDSKIWQPAYLMILAHAASDSGKQDDALKLLEMIKSGADKDDDLLLLKAIVEERKNQPQDAIQTLRLLIKTCPSSQLLPGARLRLALALKDSGQAGLALVELAAIRKYQLPLGEALPQLPDVKSGSEPDEETAGKLPRLYVSPLNRDYSGASDEQVDQMMDAMLNFAPPEELKAALEGNILPEPARKDLRAVLLQRALAREDFPEVERLASAQSWKAQFKSIASSTKETATGSNNRKRAEKMAALAQVWADARFSILSHPLDESPMRSFLYRSEDALAQYQRLSNAKAMGYADAAVEMDRRDELQHAFNWWLKAADTDPENPLAPEWLAKAQSTLPEIASLSYYALLRAKETDLPKRSKAIYDRLKSKYPRSKEARESVAYFSLPKCDLSSYMGDFNENRWDKNNYGGESLEYLDSRESDDHPSEKAWNELLGKILDLPKTTATSDEKEFSKTIEDLVNTSATLQAGLNEAFIVNFLDDMNLVAKQPGIPIATRNTYLMLRLGVLRDSCWTYDYGNLFAGRNTGGGDLRDEISKALQIDSMTPLADFLAFLNIAFIANEQISQQTSEVQKDGNPTEYITRDFPLLEQTAAEFLKKFPNSPKREAAYLLQARAEILASRGKFCSFLEDWPVVPCWDGGIVIKHFQTWPEVQPPTPKFFEDYYKEFPDEKYAGSMKSFQAELAVRQNDWKQALELLPSIIENPKASELQNQARRRIALVFSRLKNDNERPAIMEALKTNASARKYLEIYLNSSVFHLGFLKDYLRKELNLESPPEA